MSIIKDHFAFDPSNLRILVVYDLDLPSVMILTEKYVSSPPQFDVIFAIGPMTRSDKDSDESVYNASSSAFDGRDRAAMGTTGTGGGSRQSKNTNNSIASSNEANANALSSLAAIIAQLENIVCRVVYLPSCLEPLDTMEDQIHLTPNSLTIFGRKLPLIDGVCAYGYSESIELSTTDNMPRHLDRAYDIDEEIDNVEIQSGQSSIEIIREILGCANDEAQSFEASTVEGYYRKSMPQLGTFDVDLGILIFPFRFAHTLNELLFHMTDELTTSNTKLLILPCLSDSFIQQQSSSSSSSSLSPEVNVRKSSINLPEKIGSIHIASPKSLRLDHQYQSITLVKGPTGEWTVQTITSHKLLD